MTFFYKKTRQNGTVECLLTYKNFHPNITDPLTVEISEDEYNAILCDMQRKDELVYQLYQGVITVDDVPEEWREEIQQRVDELIAVQGRYEDLDIPADEFMAMIEEVM